MEGEGGELPRLFLKNLTTAYGQRKWRNVTTNKDKTDSFDGP